MKIVPTLALAVLLAGCSAGRTAAWEQDQEAVKPPPPEPTKPTGDAAAPAADPYAAAMAEAEEAWKQRDVKEQHEKAIAAWEKALVHKPGDYKALAMLSRAYYLYAETYYRDLDKTRDEYLAWTEKGTAAGEKAMIAASPAFFEAMKAGGKVEDNCKLIGKEGIEAIYWYGTNLGKWARAAGFQKILSNRPKAQACIQQVYDLDKTFFYGAAPRYFGAVYAVLPGAFGGDLDKSRAYYEESLAIAPNYVGTKVLMAENYAVKRQDRALFEKLLKEAMEIADDALPDAVAETRLEKAKARELLAKADELF